MKINLTDTAACEAALNTVNGRASVHTVAAWALPQKAREAEDVLARAGVPLNARRGVRLVYAPAGPGKAYAKKARSVVSTQVTLERGAKDWFLVDVARFDLWATAAETFRLKISRTLADDIQARALTPFDVI